MSNWCWAATAQMIGSKYRPLKSQTEIVKFVKGSAVNETAADYQVANAIYYAVDNYYEVTTRGVLSYGQIQDYIARSRVLGIKMVWNSGGAHALVLSGYTYDGKVTLIDPAAGCGTANYSYAALKSGTAIESGTGKYSKTWTLD